MTRWIWNVSRWTARQLVSRKSSNVLASIPTNFETFQLSATPPNTPSKHSKTPNALCPNLSRTKSCPKTVSRISTRFWCVSSAAWRTWKRSRSTRPKTRSPCARPSREMTRWRCSSTATTTPSRAMWSRPRLAFPSWSKIWCFLLWKSVFQIISVVQDRQTNLARQGGNLDRRCQCLLWPQIRQCRGEL